MKTFKHWKKQELVDTFGLKEKYQCDDLDNWLNSDEDISEDIKRDLVRLQQRLRRHVDDWNEQELVIQFLALFIDKIEYGGDLYKPFANRKLSAEMDGHLVSGSVDWMLSGEHAPKAPYFACTNTKRKGADNDPLGQLIIAMAVSQTINDDTNIIYGAYVMGRNWRFLTLKNHEYCVSDVYVATREDDIFTIFKILKKLKGIIEEMATETA